MKKPDELIRFTLTAEATRPQSDLGRLARVGRDAIPIVITLALWEIVVRLGLIREIFLPPVSRVLLTFWNVLISGELLSDFQVTVGRMLSGYAIGAGAAVAGGLVIGLSAPVRAFFSPLVAATYPLPKIALLSIFMVIFGIGDPPIIASIAISAFYPVLLSTISGVLTVDPVLIRAARNLGADRMQVATKIVLPGALPIILAGLKMGIAVSLIVVVAVEMYIGQSGVGYRLSWATEFFKTDLLYSNLVAIGLFGVLVFKLLDLVEWLVLPWRPRA